MKKSLLIGLIIGVSIALMVPGSVYSRVNMVNDGGGGGGGGYGITMEEEAATNLVLIRDKLVAYYNEHNEWPAFLSSKAEIASFLNIQIISPRFEYSVHNPNDLVIATSMAGEGMSVAINPDTSPYCIGGSCQGFFGKSMFQPPVPSGAWSWAFPATNAIASSPALADLDLNGSASTEPNLEAVVGSDDYKIYAVNDDGSEYWNATTGAQVQSSPAVADLDGDGRPEVVIGSKDKHVHGFKYDGTVYFDTALSPGTSQYITSAPAIADLAASSPGPEIVVTTWQGGGANPNVFILNSDGTQRAALIAGNAGVKSSPAIGKILPAAEAQQVIVVGAEDRKVYAWNADGTGFLNTNGLFVAPNPLTGAFRSSPALADIDGDGEYEVVAGTINTGNGTGKLYAWKADGNAVPGWENGKLLADGYGISSSVAIGDIANMTDDPNNPLYAYNKDLEIAVLSQMGYLYLFHHDGSAVAGWENGIQACGSGTAGEIFSSPALADVDGDGLMEVVVACKSLVGEDPAVHGDVQAYKVDGSVVTNWPTDPLGGLIVTSSVAIGNMNIANGKAEMLVGSAEGLLYHWDLGSYTPNQWPKFRHDLNNTGVYDRPDRQRPTIETIGDKTIGEGVELSFTVIARDRNDNNSDIDNIAYIQFYPNTSPIPQSAFTYAGGNTGTLSWTPELDDNYTDESYTGDGAPYFIATDQNGLHSEKMYFNLYVTEANCSGPVRLYDSLTGGNLLNCNYQIQPTIDYPNMQDNYRIEADSGSYQKIHFDINKAILVQGQNSANTVIDAQHSGTAVHFMLGAANIQLKRFKITGGQSSDKGGGILIESPATISECLVEANTAANKGGGIASLKTGPVAISNTTIINNTATNDPVSNGMFADGGSVTVAGVHIIHGNNPPPPACFLAGTPILMADGREKSIEKIKAGDEVKAFDEKSGEIKAGKVTKFFKHLNERKYLIINGQLKVTPNHRVLSKGKWVQVGTLKAGDSLTDISGKAVVIKSMELIKNRVTVYNFEVKRFHTYIAGGFIVHNVKQGNLNQGN